MTPPENKKNQIKILEVNCWFQAYLGFNRFIQLCLHVKLGCANNYFLGGLSVPESSYLEWKKSDRFSWKDIYAVTCDS